MKTGGSPKNGDSTGRTGLGDGGSSGGGDRVRVGGGKGSLGVLGGLRGGELAGSIRVWKKGRGKEGLGGEAGDLSKRR